MFVTDYGLGNIDEWIMHLKREFNSGTFQFVDPELLIKMSKFWFGKAKKYQTVSKCFLLRYP